MREMSDTLLLIMQAGSMGGVAYAVSCFGVVVPSEARHHKSV